MGVTTALPPTTGSIRSELRSEFIERAGASSVSLYLLRGRRLDPVGAAHVDAARSEQFEAISALTRGIALSTTDVRAATARSGRTHRDRYIAPITSKLGRPDQALFDDLEHRIALPITADGCVEGVIVVSGDEAVIDRIEAGDLFVPEWARSLRDAPPDFGPSWGISAMAELAGALTAAASRDEVATEVLDAGLDALGAQGGSFMLMTRPGMYELVQSRSIERRLIDRWGEFAEVPGRDPFSDAIVDRRAQFFSTAEALIDQYPHLWEDVADTDHVSWAVIPFESRPSGPIGALGAIFTDNQTFERPQRIALRSVAHLAATAALRVETQQASEQTLASLTDQLLGMSDVASTNDGLRVSGYYRPAGDFSVAGGDWFDVIDDHSRPGQTYLVLGDVADHGPPAVGAMVAVRAWIRAAVHDSLEPAEIADKVGDLIHAYRYSITTAIIARLDPGNDRITWCCAGHPHPVFVTDGTPRYQGETHGPPLGVTTSDDLTYEQSSLDIDRPTSIVLYSDGMTQQFASDPDVGADALRATVRVLADHSFCAADIVSRLSVPEQYSEDDVAVLTAHIEPSGEHRGK